MALIKCPECKKKISSTCDKCPHCGYKLKYDLDDDYGSEAALSAEMWEDDDTPLKAVLKWLGVILGAVLAAVSLAFIIYTWVTYTDREFIKNAIMAMSGTVTLIIGFTTAVLCHKLL